MRSTNATAVRKKQQKNARPLQVHKYKYGFRGASTYGETTKKHQGKKTNLKNKIGVWNNIWDTVKGCAQGDGKGRNKSRSEKRYCEEKRQNKNNNKDQPITLQLLKYLINIKFLLCLAVTLLMTQLTNAVPPNRHYPARTPRNTRNYGSNRSNRPQITGLPPVTQEGALLTIHGTPTWDPEFHELLISEKYITFTEVVNGQNFKVTVFILLRAEPLPCIHHIQAMRQHFADLEWDEDTAEHQTARSRLFRLSLRGPALHAYNRAHAIVAQRAIDNAPPPADPANPNPITITFDDLIQEFKKQCQIDQ